MTSLFGASRERLIASQARIANIGEPFWQAPKPVSVPTHSPDLVVDRRVSQGDISRLFGKDVVTEAREELKELELEVIK